MGAGEGVLGSESGATPRRFLVPPPVSLPLEASRETVAEVRLAGLLLRRQHDSVGQREVADLERLQERRERHLAFLCGGV